MSVSIEGMSRRIDMVRSYWKHEALLACKKAPIDPEGLVSRNTDPFHSLSEGIRDPVELRKRALDIMRQMKAVEQFPNGMLIAGGAFDRMEAFLYGTDSYRPITRATSPKAIIQEAVPEKRVRLTILNRNKFHRRFIEDNKIAPNLNGLIRWLREFYCGHYLKSNKQQDGKYAKAQEIYAYMNRIPVNEGMDVQEYLTTIPKGQTKYLAQIIGGNRLSSRTSKTPWGLQTIMETFYYQKRAKDTSAKNQPEVYEDNNPFPQTEINFDY